MAYAEGTSVPLEKSISEIVTLIKRAGAVRIGQMEEPTSFAIQFFMLDRMIRFRVALPTIAEMPSVDGRGSGLDRAGREKRLNQARRQRGRALLLVIKAKLESVESKVETFEEAFLANIVMHDGATVYERISQQVAVEYQSGTPQMLLERPKS